MKGKKWRSRAPSGAMCLQDGPHTVLIKVRFSFLLSFVANLQPGSAAPHRCVSRIELKTKDQLSRAQWKEADQYRRPPRQTVDLALFHRAARCCFFNYRWPCEKSVCEWNILSSGGVGGCILWHWGCHVGGVDFFSQPIHSYTLIEILLHSVVLFWEM